MKYWILKIALTLIMFTTGAHSTFAAATPHIATPQGGFDMIEVVDFYVLATVYYPATNQVQTGVMVRSGNIDAQNTTIYLGIKNKSGFTLNNFEWRIYKAAGTGQFDSGIQVLPSLPSSQTSWIQVNLPWQATEGSYQLVGIVDPNNKVLEADSLRSNNQKIINLNVGPKMAVRSVDPNQAGAPPNVSLNVDAGSCKGNLAISTSRLQFSLIAPYPMPIPFPGCSMRPEFYKGVQLQNGWQVFNLGFSDAYGNYPPPPSSTYAWIIPPQISGPSIHGQVMLSIPSRSTQCTGDNPCLIAVSRNVSITIRGPADKNPYPTSKKIPLGNIQLR